MDVRTMRELTLTGHMTLPSWRGEAPAAWMSLLVRRPVLRQPCSSFQQCGQEGMIQGVTNGVF